MLGPSVRWRDDGRVHLAGDDTLLRIHVADHNDLLNKVAADADLYGTVLDRLGYDPTWQALVLSSYAPVGDAERQQLQEGWAGRAFREARVGDLRRHEIPIWPTATFVDGVADPFNHIHFDVVAAVGAEPVPDALDPHRRGTKSERRAAREQVAEAIDPVLTLFHVSPTTAP